jgi:alpha/beta superfamily hydrolase
MSATIASAQTRRNPGAAKLRSVDLTGPAGRLEALLSEGVPDAPLAALVCHPHPLGGGNLHNKVVYHATKALNDPRWGLGLPVLRFNFRGTGLSQGSYDGKAEAGDVLAALDWLENAYKLPLVAVGFSFGAAMVLAACCAHKQQPHPRVRALVALGLPIHTQSTPGAGGSSPLGWKARDYRYPFLRNCTLPKLFLSGDRDQFAPAIQLVQVAAAAAEPKRLLLLPGADHFFTGQLEPMQQELTGWLKEQLP